MFLHLKAHYVSSSHLGSLNPAVNGFLSKLVIGIMAVPQSITGLGQTRFFFFFFFFNISFASK